MMAFMASRGANTRIKGEHLRRLRRRVAVPTRLDSHPFGLLCHEVRGAALAILTRIN